ncbi:MAG: hypothetical protein B7X58_10280, partial [Marinobacter sp. 34-60-7]
MKRQIMGILLILAALQANARDLVLSQGLALAYPEPQLISHSSNTLILKYDGWVMTHRVVDPTAIYPKIDLSGLEKEYLTSIFIPDERESFPGWLRALSEEQASEYGLPSGQVIKKTVGEAQILGTYNDQRAEGYLFVFE